MFHRFTRSVAAIASVAVVGLFAVPQVAHAANVELTITDADGAVIPRAMVAVLNSDGDAIDSGIADASGKVTIKDDNAAGYVVAAPGFGTKVVESAPTASTVKLTASTKSKLNFSNAFGGQIRPNGLAADAESGVFYATSDAQPSVWRSTDYAGSWSPVPTSAEDTEASASTAGSMTQSQAAGEIFTSAAKGEVAVQVNNELFFSRNYGSTWTKIASYSQVSSQNRKHFWVHGGDQGQSSMIFVRTESDLFAAVVPDSKTDTNPPSFQSVKTTLSGGYSAGDHVAFAVGSTGNMYMMSVNNSGTKISQLVLGGAGAPDISISTTSSVSHTMPTTGAGLAKLSTQGGVTPSAFMTHHVDGATVSFTVGYNDGASWNMSSGLEGTNSNDQMTPWNNISSLSGQCGQNGGTTLVGSIANDKPSSGEILEGMEVVGTIGQCEFIFNSAGSNSLGSQAVTADKAALLPMAGANNNTGFAWDSGFNFNDNLVAITGDGQFGLRKSADLTALTKYRPQFGSAGNTQANQFTNFQAGPGFEKSSGGIAVNGMTAPNVTDIAYDPNSTDGSRLVLSMTGTGGSRTLLSTDGGTSFSTIGAGGSYAVDWWNGAGDNQYIAAGFTNNPNEFLHVKGFTSATGTGATQMGEELAATAAVRDAKVQSERKEFVFNGAANPSGSALTPTSFVSAGGSNQQLLAAIEGIAGKDMMLVAVNKCTGNINPTGCESSAGSVALISVATNSATGATTLSNIKYFGSGVAAAGASSVSGDGTYSGAVRAVQYCPTGSASKVADTAFISVGGKGMYKISAVSSSPAHAATGTTSGTYADMKIDCDTGVIAVAGSDGPYLSIDGGTKFFQLKTSTAPAGGQAPTAVAVQADATSGDVTVAVASGDGDVKTIETTFTDMGLKGSDVAAGTATSPAAAVTPKADQINEINSANSGRKTGSVPDLELPAASGDKVDVASVKVFTVHAFATGMKLSVGSGGGAFKATVKNGSITSPSSGTPGAGTPTAGAPKVATVGVKKTATVLAQLKTLGITVVAKSKIAATSTTKSVCSVVAGTKVKGLKAGLCKLTVKITPPKTKKVPKPKTTTKRISITIK